MDSSLQEGCRCVYVLVAVIVAVAILEAQQRVAILASGCVNINLVRDEKCFGWF